MRVKICKVRDLECALEMVRLGVDFLGFHVLDRGHGDDLQRSALLAERLRRRGFEGTVLLTREVDASWIVEAATEGRYSYVQFHRPFVLERDRALAACLSSKGIRTIQVIDPRAEALDVIDEVLAHVDHVLYDSHVGGTGIQIADDQLTSWPMDRALVAGGIDLIRATELKYRFAPFGVDIQGWVRGVGMRQDIERVSALVNAAHG